MMAEKIVVGIIVAAAALYLVRRYIRTRRDKRCFGCADVDCCDRKAQAGAKCGTETKETE